MTSVLLNMPRHWWINANHFWLADFAHLFPISFLTMNFPYWNAFARKQKCKTIQEFYDHCKIHIRSFYDNAAFIVPLLISNWKHGLGSANRCTRFIKYMSMDKCVAEKKNIDNPNANNSTMTKRKKFECFQLKMNHERSIWMLDILETNVCLEVRITGLAFVHLHCNHWKLESAIDLNTNESDQHFEIFNRDR